MYSGSIPAMSQMFSKNETMKIHLRCEEQYIETLLLVAMYYQNFVNGASI